MMFMSKKNRIYQLYIGCVLCVVVMIVLYNMGLSSQESASVRCHLPEDLHHRFTVWQQKLVQISSELKRQFPDQFQQLDALADQSTLPTIYVITPTHTRPTQKAELTRLSHTLMLVPKIHWIVVEDAGVTSDLVTNLLRSSGLSHSLLNAETPVYQKLSDTDPNWRKPRGVLQRNKGLEWIRTHVEPTEDGVVYFADDDNTYSLDLFREIRRTTTVSVFPVGLVGKLRYESPIVEHGHVVDWFTAWGKDRQFPLDMAGFAVNVQMFFLHPEAQFSLEAKRGHLESSLLSGIVTVKDLQPLAKDCTEILVWHTRTEKADLRNEEKLKAKGHPGSNLHMEV